MIGAPRYQLPWVRCAGSPPGAQMRGHLDEEPRGGGQSKDNGHLGQATREGASKGSKPEEELHSESLCQGSGSGLGWGTVTSGEAGPAGPEQADSRAADEAGVRTHFTSSLWPGCLSVSHVCPGLTACTRASL
ncbi:unnamed protein product [Rangifer tarandus platyrhynchus]|uniref:Uncharacterized protein n=2 Tax=Rangifer tarandus platyrhynchus TaxID=3082113 RepID=A0ACB0DX89_RANTA|nr:unnamed protein product [Rangifer tarandus platyrhynchus]CAI9692706.1 unnamed protein product [Rangifer tarandus platyrhynchus]